MSKKQVRGLGFRVALVFIVVLAFSVLMYVLLRGHTVSVLEPKGWVAGKQRDLMFTTILLALIVVVPVFTLATLIAWKYREDNPKKARYSPDWDRNGVLEFVWWAIPCAIIFILSVMTWNSAHQLDPFRPIDNGVAPLRVQVVALEWKWLFIYPDQGIATVNYLQIPEDTPINFEITSDAPMNSFWIPQLGGQIYAMAGMSTKLHLIADATGDYQGSSANISGKGFADMKFITRATSDDDFQDWVESVKLSDSQLDSESYSQLAKQGTENSPKLYGLASPGLYDTIVHKYMTPLHAEGGSEREMNHMNEGTKY